MNILLRQPTSGDVSALRDLWIQAFGDPDFWDAFLENVYLADHCRCLLVENHLAAALTWFDCEIEDQRTAYIYAVATDEQYQHQGLCRRLMADTHEILTAAGYDSAMLVPAGGELPVMYGKMGYHYCTKVREFTCEASAAGNDSPVSKSMDSDHNSEVSLRVIDSAEYAVLRRQMLPTNSVIQEGANLKNLQNMTTLWAGQDFLLASYILEDTLYVQEYLGDPALAPAITASLGARIGKFRMPGEDVPFAMIHPLKSGAVNPDYFGLAFD